MDSYVKQPWNNDDPETPIDEDALRHIEDGIENATDVANSAVSALEGKVDRVVEPTSGRIATLTGGGGIQDSGYTPSQFAESEHTHSASDINTGTLTANRVPSLAISKIEGLQGLLDAIDNRLDDLEEAIEA